jgi:hypothetical protein
MFRKKVVESNLYFAISISTLKWSVIYKNHQRRPRPHFLASITKYKHNIEIGIRKTEQF